MENEKFQELMLDQFAKLFGKFESLSGEFQGLRTELKGETQELNGKFDGLSREFQELKDIQLRMENSLTEKAKGLYEFIEVQMDANKDVIERLDRIEAKVEVLQLETAHIRRVK